MYRVPFELPDRVRFLVDVGEESTGGFAIEAGRGYKAVVALDFSTRPAPRFGLRPIVPFIRRRCVQEQGGCAIVSVRRSIFDDSQPNRHALDPAHLSRHSSPTSAQRYLLRSQHPQF